MQVIYFNLFFAKFDQFHFRLLQNNHELNCWFDVHLGSNEPSTLLYYISLSLGFGNIAQGGDSL